MPIEGGNQPRAVGDLRSSLQELKPHYRTGEDDLATAFFTPCLERAKVYRRSAGYFTSLALVTWTGALPRLIQDNELNIRLIAAPELTIQDISVFRDLVDEEKRAEYRHVLVERILEEIVVLAENPTDSGVRARIFAWLLANERLDIRFAFAKHIEAPGIYHEKMGIFDFEGNFRVAFTGSANETLGGHTRNYESIDVYRSWVPGDTERVGTKAVQFDEAWSNEATGLDVEIPSEETVAKLRARAPSKYPKNRHSIGIESEEDSRWRHQEEAVEKFVAKTRGVLEMATGTGKTRTTLKILQCLMDSHRLRGAIVATDGTDLLDQWSRELESWVFESDRPWLVYRQYERFRQVGEFALAPDNGILVISREQLRKALLRISNEVRRQMIVVHDEVQGLGVPSLVKSLKGQHRRFAWCLGLSATPERSYDDEGNQFILEEVGPTIYEFSLKDAITRGVLCEFDYLPLTYELTSDDRKRISRVYRMRAARKKEGNPMSNEEFWTELSKVYKTAEMKPQEFAQYLKDNADLLNGCIIFVETKEYGNRLLETLHEHTTRYRTYYAEDDRNHLELFSKGEIDCLITCHRISQGIDVRSLRSVVLFASARSKLETIQRIGRCLRVDPDSPQKRALVLDFVREGALNVEGNQVPNADVERKEWLTSLAKVRRSDA